MDNTGDASLPFESELYGAPPVASVNQYGSSWSRRSIDLDAIKIEWDETGIHSLETKLSSETECSSFTTSFVAMETTSWFKLLKDEYLTEVFVREAASHDRISAVCFRTNMRRSQWYGCAEGTLRKITAPPGYYIHTIYGSNNSRVCQSLGAYFVPLALRVTYRQCSPWVAISKVIREAEYDRKSDTSFSLGSGTIRAIVAKISHRLEDLWVLNPVEYQRHFAVTDSPPRRGESVVILTEGELVTALRASVAEDRISAVQFDTTLRTTEWLGPLPGPDAVVETRSISDEPGATHIGGVFGMDGADDLESIGAKFTSSRTKNKSFLPPFCAKLEGSCVAAIPMKYSLVPNVRLVTENVSSKPLDRVQVGSCVKYQHCDFDICLKRRLRSKREVSAANRQLEAHRQQQSTDAPIKDGIRIRIRIRIRKGLRQDLEYSEANKSLHAEVRSDGCDVGGCNRTRSSASLCVNLMGCGENGSELLRSSSRDHFHDQQHTPSTAVYADGLDGISIVKSHRKLSSSAHSVFFHRSRS